MSENDAQPPPQGPFDVNYEADAREPVKAARRARRRSLPKARLQLPLGFLSGRGGLLGWGIFGAVVLLLVGGLWLGRDGIVAWVPEASRFYALFGGAEEPAGKGLSLQNVTSVRRTFDGERRLIIEGLVSNVSGNDRSVPMLRASLHDASGNELVAWIFAADVARLSPGQSASFSTLAQSPPENATELTIDFVPNSVGAVSR